MANKTWGTGTRTLKSERLFHHRKKKVYYIDQKINEDGPFIKITEDGPRKRDSIVLPVKMAAAFCAAIMKVAESQGHLPKRKEVINGLKKLHSNSSERNCVSNSGNPETAGEHR